MTRIALPMITQTVLEPAQVQRLFGQTPRYEIAITPRRMTRFPKVGHIDRFAGAWGSGASFGGGPTPVRHRIKKPRKAARQKKRKETYSTSEELTAASTLAQSRIGLAPYVDPIDLFKLYNEMGKKIPAELIQWQKDFGFQYLKFEGQFFRETGTTVKELRLSIGFEGKTPNSRRPIAFDIFPRTEWREYGAATLTVGLDLDLKFGVPLISPTTPLTSLGSLTPEIKAGFILGPFEYSFKKCQVLGSGLGNYQVDWRISKGELLNGGDFEAHVVLKTPKAYTSVTATTEMEAKVGLPGILKRLLGKTIPVRKSIRYSIPLG